jgi:uroporphyrinogen-III synthase
VVDSPSSPLAGKRVVVTRAIEQTSDLLARLTACGAVPISLPLVSFAPPEDYASLDTALNQLQSFDWIIFTSANAVHAVTTRLQSRPQHLGASGGQNSVILRAAGEDALRTGSPNSTPNIAVVGPATEAAATSSGFATAHVGKTHLGVALAQELGDRLRNKSVLLPRSDRANPDLPAALRALGVKLTEVIAYRTIPPADTDHSRAQQVLGNPADAILFFSPSAVHNFADLAGRDHLAAVQDKIAIAAVGPITARALRELGVQRIITAADTTSASVVDALAAHFVAATPSQNAPSISATGANPR